MPEINIYLSISVHKAQDAAAINRVYPISKTNVLCSFQYKKAMEGFTAGSCGRFMADSGAFTAMNSGIDIDSKYIDQYIDWINNWNIQDFIEMDLDEIIGVQETSDIRKYIERKTGKKPIPCWHLERGSQGWIDMCEKYPYVAISLSRQTKVSKWLQNNQFRPITWLLKEARKKDCKVHALGCNDFDLLKRHKFYSADSSTHTLGARFGHILQFKDGKLQNINRNRQYKVKGPGADTVNIKAMIEVMKYAEVYL